MYTTEKNIQILISLLKQYGIKKVIASPGATNCTFVGSLQNDPFFEMYSCVDERSAAYIAIGMCEETEEPIVLSCTGATASRNYMSGLTEAYYRKLPIVAITSMEPRMNVGNLRAQQIDRSILPKDIAVESVYLPPIKDSEDEYKCMFDINKALISLSQRGGGPVHIDVASTFGSLTVKEIEDSRVIERIGIDDVFPELPEGKIGIMIGAHKRFSAEETATIDRFCATNNAIVLCVNPTNYVGEYSFHPGLLFAQLGVDKSLTDFDLIIHIGEISSDYVGFSLRPKQVWRISEDGCLRDRYRTLTKFFEMPEIKFFQHYMKSDINNRTLLESYLMEDNDVRSKMPELPFSNCWIAQYTAPHIPDGANLYLGIVNSLRVWDYAKFPPNVITHSNVGGYGIDGCLSTMIGSSIMSPEKEFYGVFGDLAFFYDCNVMGNRHVGRNIHVIIINNDGGQQFRNYDHPASSLGNYTNEYVAAAGHNGSKSPVVLKHLSEDFGFKYYSASNKDEFIGVLPHFFETGCSVVIEVFVTEQEEGDALRLIRSILPQRNSVVDNLKNAIKGSIDPEKVNAIKVLLGK